MLTCLDISLFRREEPADPMNHLGNTSQIRNKSSNGNGKRTMNCQLISDPRVSQIQITSRLAAGSLSDRLGRILEAGATSVGSLRVVSWGTMFGIPLVLENDVHDVDDGVLQDILRECLV